MLQGAIVALVTPFKRGRLDLAGLRRLVEFQIKNGTSAIVPCGTTGESPTLSFSEHKQVIEATVKAVKGRIPVIAGTGANSTAEAVELTAHAKRVGADASLQVVPYYNKPTQEGLYQHFKTIANKVNIPIILYNIPGRTGVNLLPETVARLARVKNIVGIKEASGNLQQMAEVIDLCGDKFTLLSGDDNIVLQVLSIGGKGVISVVSNLDPGVMADLCGSWLSGDRERAKQLYYKVLPLCKAMFYETNPIPVKTALGMMRMIKPELRLPLAPMAPQNRERLRKVLKAYGLIKR